VGVSVVDRVVVGHGRGTRERGRDSRTTGRHGRRPTSTGCRAGGFRDRKSRPRLTVGAGIPGSSGGRRPPRPRVTGSPAVRRPGAAWGGSRCPATRLGQADLSRRKRAQPAEWACQPPGLDRQSSRPVKAAGRPSLGPLRPAGVGRGPGRDSPGGDEPEEGRGPEARRRGPDRRRRGRPASDSPRWTGRARNSNARPETGPHRGSSFFARLGRLGISEGQARGTAGHQNFIQTYVRLNMGPSVGPPL
jgi:hypothetical protein